MGWGRQIGWVDKSLVCSVYLGHIMHMTKMVATPIYGKILHKFYLRESKGIEH